MIPIELITVKEECRFVLGKAPITNLFGYIIDPLKEETRVEEDDIEEGSIVVGDDEMFAYNNFPCTAEDREMVYELVTTIAYCNKAVLGVREAEVRQLGEDIRKRLHPLKFLICIFSNKELKDCMKLIYDDPWKWYSFRDGLVEQLLREERRGACSVYAAAFAAELKIPLQDIQHFFSTKDWASLFEFLVFR